MRPPTRAARLHSARARPQRSVAPSRRWNAIITPISYYQLRFAGSPFRDSFESLLSVTFTSIALGSLLSLQLVQHRLSLRAVIILSLTTQLGVFSVMTLHTLWPVLQSVEGLRSEIARNATASFVVTLVCTAVMAATQAVLTSSVISYSAAFPPAYTKACLLYTSPSPRD